MPIVIAMNKKPLMLIFLAVAFPDACCAQDWGWPPANHSATGTRHCDCCPYRGLCEILRDRGWQPRWRRGRCEYFSCPCQTPSSARPSCGCGHGAAHHQPMIEEQEPPFYTEEPSEIAGPRLLAPEEMPPAELDSPRETPPSDIPDLEPR